MSIANDSRAITLIVVITVGRLAGRPGTWVALDNRSLVYAELPSRAEAVAYARVAATQLAAEGFLVDLEVLA